MSDDQNNPNAMHEFKTHEPTGSVVRSMPWLGGTINVTREEFAEMRKIMRGMPGHDVAEATEVCALLGLKLKEMAHKKWTVKVVDKIEARIVPPNEKLSEPGAKT